VGIADLSDCFVVKEVAAMNVQVARPTSQDSDYQFSPDPVTPWINGVTPNDGAPVSGAFGSSFRVKLDNLDWPDVGPEIVSVRLKTDSADPLVTLDLMQGTQVVATRAVTPRADYTIPPFTLTAAERAAITNYHDLHLRVTVGVPPTACCPNGLPSVLYATFSNGTGDCTCLDGQTVTLTYNSGGQNWTGLVNACGGSPSVTLVCGGNSLWSIEGTYCVFHPPGQAATSCNPLSITWNNVSVSNGCSGTVTVTVTP
jgi:hypothetical protein